MSDYIIFRFFAYWLGSMISYYYYWIKEEEDGKPFFAICYCFFWPVVWICNGIRDVWNGRKKKLLAATASAGCCIYDNEGRRIVGVKDVEVNGKWSN